MKESRKSNILEQHYINNIKTYEENTLITEILKIKKIEDKTIFFTIRDNKIGLYMEGIVIELYISNNKVFISPTKSEKVGLTKKEITSIDDYLKYMNEIREKIIIYQEKTNSMREKKFQHQLTTEINKIESLKKIYGEIYIIDAELFIFLTEYKTQQSNKGKVDLVGISEKGKLIYIEVKIDGTVILGSNGINKHCYDIEKHVRYQKEGINKLINQINKLFNKNIPFINNEIPDFVLLCAYNDKTKYDVVDQICELISKKIVDGLKTDKELVSINGSTEGIKTIYEHFSDLKAINVNARAFLIKIQGSTIVGDVPLKPYINNSYQDKLFHYTRTRIIDYLKRRDKEWNIS